MNISTAASLTFLILSVAFQPTYAASDSDKLLPAVQKEQAERAAVTPMFTPVNKQQAGRTGIVGPMFTPVNKQQGARGVIAPMFTPVNK
jgi:hypothetical protein